MGGSTYRKLMVPLAGAAAVVALTIPAPAHAAVEFRSAATPRGPGGCPTHLQDKGNGYIAVILSSGTIGFTPNPGVATEVCITSIGDTALDTIWTSDKASGDCLAWSANAQDFYNHNPNGCSTTTDYLAWNVEYEGNVRGDPYYLLVNQDTSLRFYDYGSSSAATYAACNPESQADSFFIGD